METRKFILRKTPNWFVVKKNNIFPKLYEHVGIEGIAWTSRTSNLITKDLEITIKKYNPAKHDAIINELILRYA